MIAETGHFALILALAMALIQSIVPLIGAQRGDAALMKTAEPAAQCQFVLVAIAFLALMHGYVTSDFSIVNVWQNSHSLKPLIYKISGVWGNHEGSMVLWILILTLFGACVATFGRNLPPGLRARVLSVQAMIAVAFLAFSVITSNPFARIHPAPADGQGLNPILQDPGLAFHPPFLYVGYVGFSMAFSFAVAALIEGRVDPAWARWVRPWTLAAWMFLTVGIAMGSWWAYYELGWGGWWFWDPVENASFMPWLLGTALLHSAIVVEKRDALKVWTILLAILTFSLSLIGTFLVRSGVLTSVHAFASDPARGVFILVILCIFIGGSLALFAWRAPIFRSGGLFAPISREGALVVNNLLLAVGCAAVLFGTLYPLITSAFGVTISVGAPFFNSTFVPLMIPLLLLVPLGPFMSWKRADLAAVMQRLLFAGVLAMIAIVVSYWLKHGGPVLAPLGIGLGFWLIAGAISELVVRSKLFREPLRVGLRRLFGLPRSAWGSAIAHAGLGVVVLGVVAVSAWRVEHISVMKPGEQIEIAGLDLHYVGTTPRRGPNYEDQVGAFRLEQGGVEIAKLESAKRVYTVRNMPTTEAAIYPLWSGDLYISLGDAVGATGRTVRVYYNPLAPLIWLGAVVMFLGGGISLTDRRYRVGAPKRARKAAAQTAGAA